MAIDGSYLTIMPTTSFATPGGDAVDNGYYFEGMRVQTLNKTVQLNDGTTRELSVPVCFNPRDNKYYLMDPSRKIAVAQYYDFNFDYYTVKFVTGSTRMKSGTAQKLVLNMISTSVMIRLGHVKGNKMVDMQLTNKKLVDRGTKMIMDETGLADYGEANPTIRGSARRCGS